MSGFEPGETVLRESGTTSWAVSTFRAVNGSLALTNRNLRFVAGRFQGIAEALRGTAGEKTTIPLSAISRVEKGMMATVTVHADREYVFRGMTDASGWVAAIDQARRAVPSWPSPAGAGPQVPGYGPQVPAYAPPPSGPPPAAWPAAQPAPQQFTPPPAVQSGAPKFCTSCGAAASPGHKFCGSCGARLG